jgi:hypothetical protein
MLTYFCIPFTILDIIHRPFFYLITIFRRMDSVAPTQLRPIDKALWRLCLLDPTEYIPEDGDIIQSQKRHVLNERLDNG